MASRGTPWADRLPMATLSRPRVMSIWLPSRQRSWPARRRRPRSRISGLRVLGPLRQRQPLLPHDLDAGVDHVVDLRDDEAAPLAVPGLAVVHEVLGDLLIGVAAEGHLDRLDAQGGLALVDDLVFVAVGPLLPAAADA